MDDVLWTIMAKKMWQGRCGKTMKYERDGMDDVAKMMWQEDVVWTMWQDDVPRTMWQDDVARRCGKDDSGKDDVVWTMWQRR